MIAATPFFSHRGSHVRIYEEIVFLKKRGCRVKLLTYHFGDDVKGIDTERIFNFFWFKDAGSYLSLHKIYLDLCLLFKSFFTIFRYKPDILHCHSHEGAFIGILVNIFFRKKLILDSQGSLADDLVVFGVFKRNSFFYKLCILFEKFVYNHSDVILVSNERNLDVLRDDFNVPLKKIEIVADGFNEEMIKTDKNLIEKLKKEYNLLGYRHIFVYCGTLDESQGVSMLLKTMQCLKKKRSDFAFLLMGFPNVEHYKKMVQDMEIDDIVKLLGRINYFDSFNYLSLGTCGISFKALTSEGNGKLIHFGALGIPVFCFDHFSNKYILRDNAFYLECRKEPEEYAEEINNALGHLNDLRALGDRMRKMVHKDFSNECLFSNILKAYDYNKNGKN